jgi:hypothetical protein
MDILPYLPPPPSGRCTVSKYDRLSHILQVYLEGDLELDTAAAELRHAYLERGWRFSLIEADCEPRYRDRMRALALRLAVEVAPAQDL